MFLSVAVPVYNAEQYLNTCIRSVMSQTDQDFELILVDDGSKDHSADICKDWQEKYPDKIRFIHKDNSGSLLTRRVCLQEARGEYIYIVDADDYLLDSTAFQKIHTAIKTTECDLLFFNATVMPDHQPYIQYPYHNLQTFTGDEMQELYRLMCEGDHFNSLWNKVFSRKLVDWNMDYSRFTYVTNGTDMFQMIPILFTAEKVTYLEDVIYFYRMDNNGKSIIHTFKKTIYRSLRENFVRLSDYTHRMSVPLQDADTILANRYMDIIGTSVFKIRMLQSGQRKTAYSYLKEISEDPLFRQMYAKADFKRVSKVKALFAACLNRRMYWLLWMICQTYGRVR